MSTRSQGRRRRDPHARREASRYERPIASREHILDTLTRLNAPLGLDALCSELDLDREEAREALYRRLSAMQRDGQLICDRRGRYGLPQRMQLVTGRVSAHRDGYGFLTPEDSIADIDTDLFLSPLEMRALLDGDRVIARIKQVDSRGRIEGAVVEVLERGTHSVVGRIIEESGIAFVRSISRRVHQDVLIPPGQARGAKSGQYVVVEIVEQPTRQNHPVGRVVEVLGDHMTAGMEVEVALRSHEIPCEWPQAVLAEAARIKLHVEAGDWAGREDLRALPLVTIDGLDARDFDDAVYCEPRARGWKLYVAIADVSTYVSPGSALDDEARKRGTSVYFPRRVVPMLPEALSNGICSLRPGEDRLCVVCELWVSRTGRIERRRFSEALMRSHARLTYDEVQAAVIGRRVAARRKLAPLLVHLEALYDVYKALRGARERRGALDLDTVESHVVFEEGGRVTMIEPRFRNEAHQIIEECMVAANVAAARFNAENHRPFLYRIHEPPPPDKVNELRVFLSSMGLRLQGGERPSPAGYMQLIARLADPSESRLIQGVLLRSLSQAAYHPRNVGHFGLALEQYTHFTSPIRRYPDLLVHRAIRHALSGAEPHQFVHTAAEMEGLGNRCSLAERRADEATRDALAWLKCEYMQDKIGEEFDSLVSNVTSFGVFVQVEALLIDGLVHVTALGNDYYHFDPRKMQLLGERTGTTFKLGDRLKVRLVRVDIDERKIDFELTDARGTGAGPSGRRRSTPRRRRQPRSPRG